MTDQNSNAAGAEQHNASSAQNPPAPGAGAGGDDKKNKEQEKQKKKKKQELFVRTARGVAKFRRAGMVFTREATVLDPEQLTGKQLKALRAERRLIVDVVEARG